MSMRTWRGSLLLCFIYEFSLVGGAIPSLGGGATTCLAGGVTPKLGDRTT